MKVVITGATGFLGGKIAERLSQDERFDVIATGRDKKKAESLQKLGINTQVGSLEDKDFLFDLTKDTEIIVHSAALSSPWGKYDDFYRANILATENIIKACSKNGVRRIVHISTPSIYFDYNDRFNIKEDFLPKEFVNYYASTKYEAEKSIDRAFEKGLETVSLRPRAIVGAGDTTIMPRLLKAHNTGRLKIIGDGKNIVDVTSVQNVVDAVLLSIYAEKKALGQHYNITNGEPILMWELVEKTLNKLGFNLNKKNVPFKVAYNLAKVLETFAKFTPDYKEPVITCYSVGVLAKSMTMDISKAKDLLGYIPKQTNMEAVEEFVHWWKNQ
jgi:nucleoside-diphosphate-sugar epimerase